MKPQSPRVGVNITPWALITLIIVVGIDRHLTHGKQIRAIYNERLIGILTSYYHLLDYQVSIGMLTVSAGVRASGHVGNAK